MAKRKHVHEQGILNTLRHEIWLEEKGAVEWARE
jgi:hypothetical protein